MAKYNVVIKLIEQYSSSQAYELQLMSGESISRNWDPSFREYARLGHQFFFIQFAEILSINERPVPLQWLYRRERHADVLVVRSDVKLEDFSVIINHG